jgi:hypothetical protein
MPWENSLLEVLKFWAYTKVLLATSPIDLDLATEKSKFQGRAPKIFAFSQPSTGSW